MHSGEAAGGQMNNMRSLHVCTHFNGEHVIRDLFLSLMKRYYTANMHLHMWATLGQCFPFTLDIWMASLCVLWSIFQHDNAQQPALAARIRPISSPRLLNIHPRSSTRPDNKQEARGLNAWVGRGGGQRGRRKGGGGGANPGKSGGQTTRFQGNKPSLCTLQQSVRERRGEAGGLFPFFLLFFFFLFFLVGFSWKDMSRSLLRRAGIRQSQPKFFTV